MAKTIESIADNIVRDLPGSVSYDREKAIVQVIQEFAKRSGIFKFTTEHSVTEYDVDDNANDSVALNPTGLGKFRPYRIESLKIDGVKQTLVQKELKTDLDDFDLIYKTGIVYYNVDYRGRIILFPFPADTAFETTTGILIVTIEAVYIPDESVTEIDDFFYARWGTFIEAGATGLLMAEHNKPWSSPKASSYMEEYETGRNRALMKRNLEENNGELFVQKIPFI